MADVYSSEDYTSTGNAGSRRAGYEVAEEGTGWINFAGVMLAIVGVLNIIYGIGAISDSKFFARDAQYVISDLKAWGWALTILGVIQFCAAFSIWARTEWGRWVGISTASVNSVVQLMILPAAPFMALALFSIDILIIYGLVAYGGRQGA
jgi:hypothetical protein